MGYIIWTIVLLTIYTISDLKGKYVNTLLCLVNIAAGISIQLFLDTQCMVELLLRTVIGTIFLFVAILSKEAMGIGDALVFLVIASINTTQVLVVTIVGSFLTCTIISAAGILIKHYNLKKNIPFVPFILMGYLGAIMMTEVL